MIIPQKEIYSRYPPCVGVGHTPPSDPISLAFDRTKRCLDIARNRISAEAISKAGDLITKASMLYAFGVGGSA